MKVAYLLGSLNRGGTETLMLDVFRNARQNNLDAMGVYRKSGILEQDFINSGVQMFKLPFRKNILTYLIQLRKLLKVKQIEVIHAQQPIDALYARLACMGTGIQIILTLHGYDYNDTGLTKSILGFIIKRTDTNIFVSNTQREYYQLKYSLKPEKQQVVYNGISFEKLVISSTRSATPSHAPSNEQSTLNRAPNNNLRDELQLSPDTILFGSVGNFVSVRDQLTLCRFLKLLKDEKIQFHFLFVGKRDDKMPHLYDDCVSYCQQNGLSNIVSFLGSRNDVPEILSQLDAFVYATDHDTFGIAVVEAMAVGIPVFVNDWGVMKEITEDGKFATLYKTKDEDDLLQQFMLFLQNKSAYQAKAKETSRFVRETYSIEKHIEKLKEVYKQLVISDERLVIND